MSALIAKKSINTLAKHIKGLTLIVHSWTGNTRTSKTSEEYASWGFLLV